MRVAGVLPLATAYSLTEAFGWEKGLSEGFSEAPIFYGLFTGQIVLGALALTGLRFRLRHVPEPPEVMFALPSDYALVDPDGYLWLLGRADDVLKVAGHRLGTMELESAFVSHKAIAEAAVAGKPDATKGESIIAFLVPKEGFAQSDGLREEVVAHIRSTLGPIATPDEIYFVSQLTKTRSGKIMRRLLKSIASGDKIGDVTTLEDGAAIDEVKQAHEDLKKVVRS